MLQTPSGASLRATRDCSCNPYALPEHILLRKTVDRFGGMSTGGDCLDHRCRTRHTVASRKNPGLGGLRGLAVDIDIAPFAQPHRQIVVEELGVGALADGTNDGVSGQQHVAAFDRNRACPAGSIRGPRVICRQCSTFLPDSIAMRAGESRNISSTPSRSAASISSACAGISPRVRR
jgi:hypothetical protein